MPKRSTRYYRKNEERVMKQLGFKPTKNSGSGWIEKEDGENEYSLCQLKSTDAMSISIKQNDLHILEMNAVNSHKIPVFAIQYLNTGEVWIMMKPEHIGQVTGIVEGERIEVPTTIFDDVIEDVPIDKKVQKEYNNKCDTDIAKKNYLARMKHYKQKEQEREQEERKWKERKKQIGKRI